MRYHYIGIRDESYKMPSLSREPTARWCPAARTGPFRFASVRFAAAAAQLGRRGNSKRPTADDPRAAPTVAGPFESRTLLAFDAR